MAESYVVVKRMPRIERQRHEKNLPPTPLQSSIPSSNIPPTPKTKTTNSHKFSLPLPGLSKRRQNKRKQFGCIGPINDSPIPQYAILPRENKFPSSSNEPSNLIPEQQTTAPFANPPSLYPRPIETTRASTPVQTEAPNAPISYDSHSPSSPVASFRFFASERDPPPRTKNVSIQTDPAPPAVTSSSIVITPKRDAKFEAGIKVDVAVGTENQDEQKESSTAGILSLSPKNKTKRQKHSKWKSVNLIGKWKSNSTSMEGDQGSDELDDGKREGTGESSNPPSASPKDITQTPIAPAASPPPSDQPRHKLGLLKRSKTQPTRKSRRPPSPDTVLIEPPSSIEYHQYQPPPVSHLPAEIISLIFKLSFPLSPLTRLAPLIDHSSPCPNNPHLRYRTTEDVNLIPPLASSAPTLIPATGPGTGSNPYNSSFASTSATANSWQSEIISQQQQQKQHRSFLSKRHSCLSSYSLVCQFWSSLAREQLFSIITSSSLSTSPRSLSYISKSPHLAKLVRRLYLGEAALLGLMNGALEDEVWDATMGRMGGEMERRLRRNSLMRSRRISIIDHLEPPPPEMKSFGELLGNFIRLEELQWDHSSILNMLISIRHPLSLSGLINLRRVIISNEVSDDGHRNGGWNGAGGGGRDNNNDRRTKALDWGALSECLRDCPNLECVVIRDKIVAPAAISVPRPSVVGNNREFRAGRGQGRGRGGQNGFPSNIRGGGRGGYSAAGVPGLTSMPPLQPPAGFAFPKCLTTLCLGTEVVTASPHFVTLMRILAGDENLSVPLPDFQLMRPEEIVLPSPYHHQHGAPELLDDNFDEEGHDDHERKRRPRQALRSLSILESTFSGLNLLVGLSFVGTHLRQFSHRLSRQSFHELGLRFSSLNGHNDDDGDDHFMDLAIRYLPKLERLSFLAPMASKRFCGKIPDGLMELEIGGIDIPSSSSSSSAAGSRNDRFRVYHPTEFDALEWEDICKALVTGFGGYRNRDEIHPGSGGVGSSSGGAIMMPGLKRLTIRTKRTIIGSLDRYRLEDGYQPHLPVPIAIPAIGPRRGPVDWARQPHYHRSRTTSSNDLYYSNNSDREINHGFSCSKSTNRMSLSVLRMRVNCRQRGISLNVYEEGTGSSTGGLVEDEIE